MIFLLALVSSCEKPPVEMIPDQNPESENMNFDPAGSVERSVSINTSEIGGEGLTLVSARSADAPILNESFMTSVSKDGTQLLTVIDSQEKLRGLTLSTPLKSDFEVMKIDAQSTALTLVFISPGILSVDPLEASKAIDEIQNLTSFSPLKKFIRNNLQSKSLNEIVETDVYNTLLTDCVEEYNNKKTKGIQDENSKGSNYWMNDFSVTHTNGRIEFRNRAFRYARVTEIDRSSANNLLMQKTVYPVMKGAIPLSWGSIFTFSYLSDTKKSISYNPIANTAYSEFWVDGLGKKTSQIEPPVAIKDKGIHDVATMLFYVVFPVLELTAGTSSLMNIPQDDIIRLASLFLNIKCVGEFFLSNTFTSTCRALANVIISISKEITKHPEAIKKLSANYGATIVKEASSFLRAASIIMGAGNLALFTTNLYLVEPYTRFIIYAKPPLLPSLSAPGNGLSNLPNPVTFRWNAITNADSYELRISKYNNFSSTVYSCEGITSNQKQVSNLVNGVKYYWHVRAKNQFGYSIWSETWSFTK